MTMAISRNDASTTEASTETSTGTSTARLQARVALAVATFLSGLFAGFFVTYQISVIRGLAQVDDLTYVQTFQSINATVRTAEFAVIFFGTFPALALALFLNRRGGRSTVMFLASALVMAIATLAITLAGNVPLNEELAAVEALTPEIAAAARSDFEGPWNQLNLVRTLTAVLSAAGAACALVARRSPAA